MCKVDLEKAEASRDQIANFCWIIEKEKDLKKHILLLCWLH